MKLSKIIAASLLLFSISKAEKHLKWENYGLGYDINNKKIEIKADNYFLIIERDKIKNLSLPVSVFKKIKDIYIGKRVDVLYHYFFSSYLNSDKNCDLYQQNNLGIKINILDWTIFVEEYNKFYSKLENKFKEIKLKDVNYDSNVIFLYLISEYSLKSFNEATLKISVNYLNYLNRCEKKEKGFNSK